MVIIGQGTKQNKAYKQTNEKNINKEPNHTQHAKDGYI